MALRLPIATRSVRRPSQGRRVATIVYAAFVLSVIPLRILLAALSIATWTSAWRTIDIVSRPFVLPLRLFDPLETELIGRMALADIVALLIFGGLAIYLLALLTVRRQR